LPVEFTVGAGIETRHFSAETALLNNNNHTGGRLLILRDITQDKQAERQRLALQRAIATQEEKERLARQLHDGVGQVIGYLHRQAQKAPDYWTQGQPALANAAVTHLAEVAADAHADLRDFVLGIPAEPDSRQGLLSPLRRYAGQLASTDGLSIRLQVEDSFADDKLDPQVQTELLSIIKEALSNVRNHAATKQAEVVLSASSESVKVVIQDQGCGFDLARVQSGPARLGLDILRARAIRAGGLLQILTAPGKGTQVVVELPVVRVDSPITLPDLRVLLADDQPLYRQGLRALLAARPFGGRSDRG
jgi:signal transduction histidine kinase